MRGTVCLSFTVFIFLTVFSGSSFSQEVSYSARVTDRSNNEYLLHNFKRYEYDSFNCRLHDTPFKLSFSQVRSIDFVELPDTTVKGYTLANVVLVDGNTATVYLSSDSTIVGGTESNFKVELKIPLGEIKTITFIRE
jgi:hypothetical protein